MLTVIRSKFFTHLPILRYSCNSRHPRGTDWSPISWQSSLLLPAFFSSAFPAFWAPRAFSVFCLPKNYVPKLGMPPPQLYVFTSFPCFSFYTVLIYSFVTLLPLVLYPHAIIYCTQHVFLKSIDAMMSALHPPPWCLHYIHYHLYLWTKAPFCLTLFITTCNHWPSVLVICHSLKKARRCLPKYRNKVVLIPSQLALWIPFTYLNQNLVVENWKFAQKSWTNWGVWRDRAEITTFCGDNCARQQVA